MKTNTETTNTYRKWLITVICVCITLIISIAGINAIVDPYFHYHKPVTAYRLYEERNINDGIARHFDYDAIIIGNSLTENFRTTRFDELFGTNSVKLPYSGAGVRELWAALGRTLGRKALNDNNLYYVRGVRSDIVDEYDAYKGYRNDVKTVFVCMDIEDGIRSFWWTRYNESPDYLYDDSLINDIRYLMNKETFYRGTIYNLGMTLTGKESTGFDEYSSWERESGPKQACQTLTEIKKDVKPQRFFGDEEKEKIYYNVECNIFPVVDANPDVDFILFIPPFSIAKWAEYYNDGELEYRLDNTEYLINKLLERDNIRLYSFLGEYDVVTNLSRYCDEIHYDQEINDWILARIAENENGVDEENVNEYFDGVRRFYINYDYTTLNEYIR